MRDLSTQYLQACLSQESSEVALALLTIEHEDLPATLRYVNNTVAVVSRGNTYNPIFFDVRLPSSIEGQPPQASLAVDNVSLELIAVVRSIPTSPNVTIEIVLADSPNTIEASYPDLSFKRVASDALMVSGSLTYEDTLSEPFPGDTINAATFPGLFGVAPDEVDN